VLPKRQWPKVKFKEKHAIKLEEHGRIVAAEINPDSEEKRMVGAVWASRSGGKCLFAMPTEGDFSAITKLLKSRRFLRDLIQIRSS
jgi:type III restriction enzyme